jgi:23S rRNA pseudouridine1911/1915/1917 synthase
MRALATPLASAGPSEVTDDVMSEVEAAVEEEKNQNQVTVPEALHGKRVDAIVKHLFDIAWNAARDAVSSGKITVDGKPVVVGGVVLKTGQVIVKNDRAPRRERRDVLREEDVVHIDDNVIVVNKPAFLSTIPFDDETDTLDARVRSYLSRKHMKDKTRRPELGVVHRIDKDTTGLVVFTRNWAAKNALSEQFREHTVHRVYRAIMHGVPKVARLESMLVRNRGDGLRGTITEESPQQQEKHPAITHFHVEESFLRASLVRVTLETGRTHQIRIHASESGHPLLGEEVYVRDYLRELIYAPRLMLHAGELGFTVPGGKQLSFKQPLPRDMEYTLQRLRDANKTPVDLPVPTERR